MVRLETVSCDVGAVWLTSSFRIRGKNEVDRPVVGETLLTARLTFPLKFPSLVTVMVEERPEAPTMTFTSVAVTLKLGGITVSVTIVE